MKFIFSLLLVVLFATPTFADQALVLTEIEQIQEKIWYLQRDVAAQKSVLEKNQKDIKTLRISVDEKQQAVNKQLETLMELTNRLHAENQKMQASLQNVADTVTTFNSDFEQQNAVRLQQAARIENQQELLQNLRREITASQEKMENALAETSKKLAEAEKQLASMQQQSHSFGQTSLYIGGAALILAILLSLGFVFLNSKLNKRDRAMNNRSTHEF